MKSGNLSSSMMSPLAIAQENARFMSKVYRWMAGGVLLSGGIAHTVASNESFAMALLGNKILFWGMIIAQFAAVIYLAVAIKKMSATTATVVYLSYAALTGVTLSSIFFVYTQQSILNVFLISSCAFAGLSAFGYITKKDLGPVGSFCHMGLWGLIGFSILSFFFPSLMGGKGNTIFALIGLVVFAGLTAYDTQKIKQMNIIGNEGTAEDHKEAIYGALTLYLDFINMFLMLLRLMGDRK